MQQSRMAVAERILPECDIYTIISRAAFFEDGGQLGRARGELTMGTRTALGKASPEHHLALARLALKQGDIQTAGESIARYELLMEESDTLDKTQKDLQFVTQFFENVGIVYLAHSESWMVAVPVNLAKESDISGELHLGSTYQQKLSSQMLNAENGLLVRQSSKKVYLPAGHYFIGPVEYVVREGVEEILSLEELGDPAYLASEAQRILAARKHSPELAPFREVLPDRYSRCVQVETKLPLRPSFLKRNLHWIIIGGTALVAGATLSIYCGTGHCTDTEYDLGFSR